MSERATKSETTAAETALRERARAWNETDVPEIDAWLRIAEDGAVTVFTGKVEVGQGIRTSLSQAVAEELRAPLAAVYLVMGDTERVPFDMGTFGSRTTPTMGAWLRNVAATARDLLIDLAAERWQTDRSVLVAADGKVRDGRTGRTIGFGELTGGRPLAQVVREDVALTSADGWTVAGTSVPRVDARALVTGEHRFAHDVTRPGMIWGRVLRPPAFNATLVSIDTREAEAMEGVTVVRDGTFVGIAAPDKQVIGQALRTIRAQWEVPPQPSRNDLADYLRTHPAEAPIDRRGGGPVRFECGAVAEGLAAADHTVERSYTVAYVAHAPLEPRAAVAEWSGDRLTVWTGTQRPFGVRAELAAAFGIPEEHVRVVVPDTGSGYGGKHTGDAAVEAARLARAAGKPVKLTWTREEEFTWAYFRPAGVIDIISGVRGDGAITAWEFHDYNSGAAAIATPYNVPHQRIELHFTRSPLRQGSYRALAATANHFARETHVDELAHAVGMDPLAFRLRNLQDPRMRAVLETAAGRFGWGEPKTSPDRGVGIACGFEKGGYVATCAQVVVDRSSGRVGIVRVVEAFECGAVVNPDGLVNQAEGAIVQAIGGALFEMVDFENGKVLNGKFSRYRVPRFGDVPAIDVVLIDRRDLPSAGGGETPIVGLAPAVGNAIFDATGIRLRSLPLAPNGLAHGGARGNS